MLASQNNVNMENISQKNVKTYTITDEQSILNFFQSLYTDHDLNFHPDDPFETYIGENDQPTFTKEEADYLNSIVQQCFDWCEANGKDVYVLAGEIQIREWHKRGIYNDEEFKRLMENN